MADACEFYICAACGTSFALALPLVVVSICVFRFYDQQLQSLHASSDCLSVGLTTVGSVNIYF